jgi:hypothetical protein
LVHTRRHVLIALGAILIAALLVRLAAWHSFPNQIWPDEIFQSLEQAHRVVYGYGIVPWEFRDGARSWVLPGMLVGVMGLMSFITSSVTAYLAACATVLSAISLAPIWATFRTALSEFGLRGAIVAGAVLACWFELVYFAPKALNEVVAGNGFVVGVLLADACVRRPRAELHARSVVVATMLLALASVLRIQLSIAAVVCFCYLVWPLAWRLRWPAIAAGAAVVLFAGLVDWLTWDYPFQSFVENIRVNIVEERSKIYGVAPSYAYFRVFGDIWGVWSALVMGLAIAGTRSRPLLGACALIVIATHLPIAHKEYRFAYPAMALVLALAAIGAAQLVRWVEQRKSPRIATLAAAGLITVWVAASLQGAVGFDEGKTRLAISFHPPSWHWTQRRGGLLAMKQLGEEPSVCGVAMLGFDPFLSGGYTYLHRDIPIFHVLRPAETPAVAMHANVFLVYFNIANEERLGDFTRDTCIAEVCIYRRSGPCAVTPGYSYNRVLEGQRR